jgi:hypothetical protein
MHQGSNSALGEIYFALCKSVDSPFSLKAWILFREKEFLQLAELDLKPGDYSTASRFSGDYLILNFLRKYKGLETGIDLKAKAIQKFIISEDLCRETNRTFKDDKLQRFHPLREQALLLARRKIARLLGKFSFEAIERLSGWGPGATYELPRRRSHRDVKLTKLPITVTETALSYAQYSISSDLHWSASILGISPDDIQGPFCFCKGVFEIIRGSRHDTVPKDSKTDRNILVEPRMNAFLQKGVGTFIRKRLRSVSVDLNDQSINQSLALRAYDELLATVDLKAASDSVSVELVRDLLPREWFEYMDRIRSRFFCFEDRNSWTKLEKFSSMGNGFTFELESLIFWAIGDAVRDMYDDCLPFSVYGDDIIVSQKLAPIVVDVLGSVGFQVNDDKSFLSGDFFESCGKHYFKGNDVTPCYQKEIPSSLDERIRLANRLLRHSHRVAGCEVLSADSNPFFSASYSAYRCAIRIYGLLGAGFLIPFGSEGDDGLLVLHNDFPHFDKKMDRNMGLSCSVLGRTTRRLPGVESALLANALRFGNSDIPSLGDILVESDIWVRRKRRIHPTGEFWLTSTN